jgi:ABC-2 type transport system permease protein
MIGHIAARELRSLFLSPLAWVILAVVAFILGFLFLAQLDQYLKLQPRLAMMPDPVGVTEVVVAPLFATATIVMMLVMPLLTMRLISEERRSGTLPLLFSAPVSMSEIILGKYMGILGFLGAMVMLLALMPLSLLLGGNLDFGLLAAALLGVTLMLAAFAAAGMYMSTLTAQPTVAAISTFGLLLLFWVIDWAGRAVDAEAQTSVFSYLSLQRHYQALLRGAFDTSDIIYFALFIIVFLTLSIRRLDADRLQH